MTVPTLEASMALNRVWTWATPEEGHVTQTAHIARIQPIRTVLDGNKSWWYRFDALRKAI